MLFLHVQQDVFGYGWSNTLLVDVAYSFLNNAQLWLRASTYESNPVLAVVLSYHIALPESSASATGCLESKFCMY